MNGSQHIHNSLKCLHYVIYAPSNLFSTTVTVCLLQMKYPAWPEDIPVSRNKDKKCKHANSQSLFTVCAYINCNQQDSLMWRHLVIKHRSVDCCQPAV